MKRFALQSQSEAKAVSAIVGGCDSRNVKKAGSGWSFSISLISAACQFFILTQNHWCAISDVRLLRASGKMPTWLLALSDACLFVQGVTMISSLACAQRIWFLTVYLTQAELRGFLMAAQAGGFYEPDPSLPPL